MKLKIELKTKKEVEYAENRLENENICNQEYDKIEYVRQQNVEQRKQNRKYNGNVTEDRVENRIENWQMCILYTCDHVHITYQIIAKIKLPKRKIDNKLENGNENRIEYQNIYTYSRKWNRR